MYWFGIRRNHIIGSIRRGYFFGTRRVLKVKCPMLYVNSALVGLQGNIYQNVNCRPTCFITI